MEWENHLSSVICWAESKGYFVILDGNDDCMCNESKIIELNQNNDDLELKTYIALHEAGHVLIYENGSANSPSIKEQIPDESTLAGRTMTVIHEVEAWRRGFNLAKRLKLPKNTVKWEGQVADAIKKYIVWAAEIK